MVNFLNSHFFKYTKRIILLSVLLLMVVGCDEDASIHLAYGPRFVNDQTDPDGSKKRNDKYPDDYERIVGIIKNKCDYTGVPLAGMDMLLEYSKKDGSLDSDERIFQVIRYKRRISNTISTSQQCGDDITVNDVTVVEMFNPKRNWDVITAHACSESKIELGVNSVVGVVDIDDLPDRVKNNLPRFRDKQNAMILGGYNHINGKYFARQGLNITISDIVRTIALAQENKSANWNAIYKFDGCNGPGQRITDECIPSKEKIHCLKVNLKDSNRKKSKTFYR